jgi:hypothetical protein
MIRIAALVASVALAAAPIARAADGVLEINQACAATGCFAGDAADFPVTITASGSYRLTSNLVVPAATTTAISAGATDVTIDLGGFSIRGPNVCSGGEPVTSCSAAGSGAGIAIAERAQIFGGSITGMGTGIATAHDARLRDLVVSHSVGTGIDTGRGTVVHATSIVDNGGIGVRANTGGGDVEVSGCTIRGNGAQGIVVSDGLAIGNRISRNALAGIAAGGTFAIAHNQIDGNNGGTNEVTGAEAVGCNTISGSVICPP